MYTIKASNLTAKVVVVIVVSSGHLGGSLDEIAVGSGHIASKSLSLASVHLQRELHLLTLGQRAESLGMDGSLMHEHIIGTIIRSDETKSLGHIEELHGTTASGEGSSHAVHIYVPSTVITLEPLPRSFTRTLTLSHTHKPRIYTLSLSPSNHITLLLT